PAAVRPAQCPASSASDQDHACGSPTIVQYRPDANALSRRPAPPAHRSTFDKACTPQPQHVDDLGDPDQPELPLRDNLVSVVDSPDLLQAAFPLAIPCINDSDCRSKTPFGSGSCQSETSRLHSAFSRQVRLTKIHATAAFSRHHPKGRWEVTGRMSKPHGDVEEIAPDPPDRFANHGPGPHQGGSRQESNHVVTDRAKRDPTAATVRQHR